MFKAIDSVANQAIIILDPIWQDPAQLEDLRDRDRRNRLICQECHQPVRVRAGTDRQWHFAHKHRQQCTYQSESYALVQARAALYRWLVGKFDTICVELEAQIGGDGVPRPVDCWVWGEQGPIAFWISESGIKAHARTALRHRFAQLHAQVQWLFTSAMLQEQEEPGEFNLSTTERDCMIETRYDTLYTPPYRRGATLHYLDGEHVTLTTLRGLHQIHGAHIFAGSKIINPLCDVQIIGRTGDFVHPGEHAAYTAYAVAPPPQPVPHGAFGSIGLQQQWSEPAPAAPIKVGTCVFCGQQTDDWWWYDGASGTCKCRPCQRTGRG